VDLGEEQGEREMTGRPMEQFVAGDAFIKTLVSKADADNRGAPLWHGWAVMDGFLAGIDWQKENQTWEEAGMSIGPYNLRVLQASGGSNIVGAHTLARDLHDKAAALVALLDDAEVNHGGLWSGKTMRARDELRQELARWR
jgi:hypothetical protein